MRYIVIILALFVVSFSGSAAAREHLYISGSSTVFPFVALVAEEFGDISPYPTPVVESIGTGGGFSLFCKGMGDEYPDITDASRIMKESEEALCRSNGVTDFTALNIGYDGIVIANALHSEKLHLTSQQLFLALAKYVPQNGQIVANPYQTWKDIDPSLPDATIKVFGPPSTSGTRDVLISKMIIPACMAHPEFQQYVDYCHLLREDGKYVNSGENDNLIVLRLLRDPESVGIFGYNFLDQNRATLQASSIDGVELTADNILNRSYPLARPIFVYIKNKRIHEVKGMDSFVNLLVQDSTIGKYGYLTFKGLVSLPEQELIAVQRQVGHIGG